MVNVSKHEIPASVDRQIKHQLARLLASAPGENSAATILGEILTDSERLMLAKRLAIVAMLHNNCSSYEISLTLSVSTATVKRIRIPYDRGAFLEIIKLLEHKKRRGQLIDSLEAILRAGMPPIGRDRWSRTFKLIDAKKK